MTISCSALMSALDDVPSIRHLNPNIDSIPVDGHLLVAQIPDGVPGEMANQFREYLQAELTRCGYGDTPVVVVVGEVDIYSVELRA